MNKKPVSATPKGYFEDMYRADPDPWGFDSSHYEARKHALTVSVLPESRYRYAVEPGCANGNLTARLAERCDQVHAFDFIDDVVDQAQRRLSHLDHVKVSVQEFPAFWPPGNGDLVVWSEVIYYLGSHGRSSVKRRLFDWLEPGGVVVSCHYTGTTDYPMSGQEVATWIDSFGGLQRICTLVDEMFELAVWRRR